MEMTPGAIPRPGGVPEQRLLSPETCRRWRRRCGTLRGNWLGVFGVFASEGINRRRGNVGGGPGLPPHLPARLWAQPRERVVWRPWASPWLALLAPCVPRKNRRFGFCFVEFREYCPNSFSGTKNSRKQELALWHLVNRLVPENV